jgi:hypothetical protein
VQKDPAGQLISALADLKDYGSLRSTAAGAITIPSVARDELGLPVKSQWQVMGSPALGVALLVARHTDPKETLEFFLRAQADPDSDHA